MFKNTIILIGFILLLNGCTKDDICPDGEAITPNLIITFNDIANPLLRKEVNVLSVLTDNLDSTAVVRFTRTDSIAIPLNTNSDTTKYLFKRSIISGNDTINNIDKVQIIYQRKNEYVNRACGFKTEFVNIATTVEAEGSENWIQEITEKRQNVNDENSAHLSMLH